MAISDKKLWILYRGGITGLNKAIFLQLLKTARAQTMQPRTIRSAFKAAGLIPFNPSRVLQKLPNARTPSPLPSQPRLYATPSSGEDVERFLRDIRLDTSLRTHRRERELKR